MNVRKHLDDERFDLAFEAIDELYCHAYTNDLVKATSEIQNIKMRPSEKLIKFFNRFRILYRNHVLLHGRDKVTTGLGTKFIYPPRAFVENNCCVEDMNNECKAILTDYLKESQECCVRHS
jgi:hypothetical protein